jgi:hypothetical protein
MGFSIRAFLVNEMGELQSFSYARFQRLSRLDPKESLPGHVGTYARFAIAYIETVEEDPPIVSTSTTSASSSARMAGSTKTPTGGP